MEFMRVGRTPPSGVWSGALRQTVRLRHRVSKGVSTNARLCVIVWCGVLGQEYTVSPKPPTRAINPATMGRGRRAGGRFGTDGSQR